MILTSHLLFGAMIASKIQNPFSVIILAFLSHYFLDFLPHNEYSIKNIINKKWKKSLPDISKVILDMCAGGALVFFLSERTPITFIAAFFAIVPDGILVLNSFFKNKALKYYNDFHSKKIHFLKYKKIPVFWGILTQISVIIISVALLI